MDHDLAGLIELHSHMKWFKPEQIKCYMKQLLSGLHYLHKNNVLHRDIKASNLLISNRGVLKLADFGLARPISKKGSGNYTNNVITLWYRPPELLLGAHKYGSSVDCWSVGCILAELLYKKPIFPGKTEIDQLDLIFRLCGSPTDENWADAKNLPWYKSFKPKKIYKPRLREAFKHFPPNALDLVEKLLTLDPKKRITAEEALDSQYFWTDPYPCEPGDIPEYPSSHEYTAKKRKQRQQMENQSRAKRQKTNDWDSREPIETTNPPVPPPPNNNNGGGPSKLHNNNNNNNNSNSNSNSNNNKGREPNPPKEANLPNKHIPEARPPLNNRAGGPRGPRVPQPPPQPPHQHPRGSYPLGREYKETGPAPGRDYKESGPTSFNNSNRDYREEAPPHPDYNNRDRSRENNNGHTDYKSEGRPNLYPIDQRDGHHTQISSGSGHHPPDYTREGGRPPQPPHNMRGRGFRPTNPSGY